MSSLTKWKSIPWFRLLIRKQGLVLRIFVCWGLAALVMVNDESRNFDTRFKIRGEQRASREIVLLTFRPADLNRYYDLRTQNLLSLNELTAFTDSFFWDQKLWHEVLRLLLEHEPRAIGITLFFGESLGPITLNPTEAQIFFHPKVIWSAQIGSFDQMIPPILARADLANLGHNEIYRDEDGLVRKIISDWIDLPHLSEKLVGESFPRDLNSYLINFRGPSRVFSSISVNEILNREIPRDYLKGKIVLIGAESASSNRFLTPVGLLSRSEVMAHITDNLLENRWIRRYHSSVYLLYGLVLVLLATLIVTQYPQSVAFAFLFWVGLLCVALSIWMFDSFNIWIPAVSPVILIFIVWVVFVGYQASKVERRNYMLEQEQRYLQELEQLKSNFVSLISHDLKTPLAKIQAVVDRLKSQAAPEIRGDLGALEDYNNELNRYIQSILKVMRVESRDFQLNRVSTDLNELVEDVSRSLKPLAEIKSLRLNLQLEPLFLVDLDPTLIREVIHNLIENAIKYSPTGKEIFLHSFETPDEIGFEVRDQGEGIPPEELAAVWGKFVRGQNQSLKSKGSGLGLYLVKYFVELHGGRVALQSQVGQGTQVLFYLPLNSEGAASGGVA
ncbi:MAG: CHASE2 domain-containing protein [Bdellovibrionales bacterium]